MVNSLSPPHTHIVEFMSENIVGSVLFIVTILWIPPSIVVSIIVSGRPFSVLALRALCTLITLVIRSQ